MKRSLAMLVRRWLHVIVLVSSVAAALVFSSAQAQGKNVTLARRDVDCTVQANGDVRISETWELQYSGGPFTDAYLYVNLKYVNSVDNFHITEGGQDYQPGTTQAPDTFMVYQEKGLQYVKWFYTPASDSIRTFKLQYTLHGIVRIYDDGDMFLHEAIEPNRAYPIQNATVTVHLPVNFRVEKLDAQILKGQGEAKVRDGQTVIFTARDLKPSDALIVGVQFPHGVITAAKSNRQILVDTANEYYEKALDHANAQQLSDALDDLNEAVKLRPDDFSDYYVIRGNVYDDLGDLDHALADYARAIEIDPKDANAYHERGYAYERQDRFAEALAEYSIAVSYDPKNSHYFVHRAQVYDKQGHFDLTFAEATKAIGLDLDDYAAYYWRGHACLMQGKYDQAISDSTRAINLNRDLALAYEVRGLAYGAKADASRAIADLQTYLKQRPDAADRSAIEGALKSLGAAPAMPATAIPAGSTPNPSRPMSKGGIIPGDSIANAQLQGDVWFTVMLLSARGCAKPTPVDSLVLAVADAKWSERWVIDACGKLVNVRIDFTRAADGGTDYSVKVE